MSPTGRTPDAETRLQKAVRTAVAREERTESPRGEWHERLWYPADGERQACCAPIKPTESNRQALESHCRTQAHIAQLFDVPLPELRRAVRQARAEESHAEPLFHRSPEPHGSPADALFEASRGAHGAALENLREEALRFETVLPRLIEAGETDDLLELLDDAAMSIDRLKLTVEYCRQVETTYDSARAVRDLVARLYEQEKKSA
jgi:hypothetical protein